MATRASAEPPSSAGASREQALQAAAEAALRAIMGEEPEEEEDKPAPTGWGGGGGGFRLGPWAAPRPSAPTGPSSRRALVAGRVARRDPPPPRSFGDGDSGSDSGSEYEGRPLVLGRQWSAPAMSDGMAAAVTAQLAGPQPYAAACRSAPRSHRALHAPQQTHVQACAAASRRGARRIARPRRRAQRGAARAAGAARWS